MATKDDVAITLRLSAADRAELKRLVYARFEGRASMNDVLCLLVDAAISDLQHDCAWRMWSRFQAPPAREGSAVRRKL